MLVRAMVGLPTGQYRPVDTGIDAMSRGELESAVFHLQAAADFAKVKKKRATGTSAAQASASAKLEGARALHYLGMAHAAMAQRDRLQGRDVLAREHANKAVAALRTALQREIEAARAVVALRSPGPEPALVLLLDRVLREDDRPDEADSLLEQCAAPPQTTPGSAVSAFPSAPGCTRPPAPTGPSEGTRGALAGRPAQAWWRLCQRTSGPARLFRGRPALRGRRRRLWHLRTAILRGDTPAAAAALRLCRGVGGGGGGRRHAPLRPPRVVG